MVPRQHKGVRYKRDGEIREICKREGGREREKGDRDMRGRYKREIEGGRGRRGVNIKGEGREGGEY